MRMRSQPATASRVAQAYCPGEPAIEVQPGTPAAGAIGPEPTGGGASAGGAAGAPGASTGGGAMTGACGGEIAVGIGGAEPAGPGEPAAAAGVPFMSGGAALSTGFGLRPNSGPALGISGFNGPGAILGTRIESGGCA